MGLTDGLTFILFNLHMRMFLSNLLLTSPGDPASGQIVGRHLNGHLVTGQDLNEIHSELAGNGCQNGVAIAEIYLKHCVGQIVGNDAFNLDYVVFCQDINLPGRFLALSGLDKPDPFEFRC